MADAFDAYHVWLGIPPKDQPPNHYRLLGLELFEQEPGVIENAADRQMGHVRRHQTGRHAVASQKLLNEIAAARVCLLHAARKQKYDSQLRAELAPVTPPAVPVGVPVSAAPAPQASPAAPPVTVATAAPPPLPRPAAPPAKPAPAKLATGAPVAVSDNDFPRWRLIVLGGGIAGIGGLLTLALVTTIVVWLLRGEATDMDSSKPASAAPVAADDAPESLESSYDPEKDAGANPLRPVVPENDEPQSDAAKPADPPPAADDVAALQKPFVLREMTSSPVDLLAAIDPASGTVRGIWNRLPEGQLEVERPDPLEEKLLGTRAPVNLLAAPIAPPSNYRLKLSAVRRDGMGGLGLGLVVGDSPMQVLLRIDEGGVASGVEGIDGKSVVDAPLARRDAPLFPPGVETEVVLEVNDGQVTLISGDETVLQWQGDPALLSPAADWTIPHEGAIFLAAEDAGFEIRTLELDRIEAPPATAPTPVLTEPLPPLARWTFNENFQDAVGEMHGTPQGAARIEDGQLWLDGSSYVETTAAPADLNEKTLELWLTLATLDQQEGGAMSIFQGEGRRDLVFDGLVFSQQPHRTWRAANARRRRSKDYNAPEESTADKQPVHLAVVYHADGNISIYRNGKAYAEVAGRELTTFQAGQARVAFGRRAPPADGLLACSIDQAQLFDRALTAEQIAALADTPPVPPTVVPKPLVAAPDEAAIAQALERVRQAYNEEFAAAKNPAQKRALAEKLLRGAEATTSDAVGRYALLLSARDALAQAGDATAAFSVIDRAAEDFRIDAFRQRNEVLPVAARSADAPRAMALAEAAQQVANQAVRRDDFAAARQSLQIAHAAARQARATALIRQIGEHQRQVSQLAEKFDDLASSRAALETNPDDPAANLAVGMYRCFVRDDWESGLPLLAKGDHETLRGLAEREADAPTEPPQQIQLGDAWWDAAAAPSGDSVPAIVSAYVPALRRRAVHWYRLAAPHLPAEDLGKLVAERRIREFETASNDGWRIIFRGTGPALWNTSVDKQQAFAVPLENVSESIKFLRLKRTDTGQYVILPINKQLLADGGAVSQNVMWRVETNTGGVGFLGVASGGLPVATAGQPYLVTVDKSAYGGWGFGGLWQDATARSFSWAGQAVSDAELEISVKSEALSADEQKLLLR